MLTNLPNKILTLFVFVSSLLLCLPSLIFSQEWQGLSPGKAKETLSLLQVPLTNEAFFKAIEEDDVRVVRLFHQAGVDLNTREDGLGQSPPIFVAASYGSSKVFKYLLENKVDVNIRNQWNGRTALVKAISWERWEMVWALLNAGAVALHDPTISLADTAGSALTFAIISEDPILVKELLKPERGAFVNERGIFQETPLIRASRYPSVQVVKLLLEAGASVTDVDMFGGTALIRALGVKEGPQFGIVRALIAAGSDVNHKVKNGAYPLMAATFLDDQYILRLLLENRANPNEVFQAKKEDKIPWAILGLQNKDVIDAISGGITPLMIAAVLGHDEAVRVLLEYGADPKISAQGRENSYTAESLAASARHMEIAEKIKAYSNSACKS